MPRPAKPARLWLRPARGRRAATWVIIDRGRQHGTGCGQAARGEAEKRLVAYLGKKHDPAGHGRRSAHQTPVSDVISVYLDDVVPGLARPAAAAARADRLLDWWGGMMLSEVTPVTCRAYVQARTKGGARRDLEDLRAAVGHHARRGLHVGLVRVELPPKGRPRSKYMTPNEVARLLWVCWRHKREEIPPRGPRKGQRVESAGFHDMRHVARFILLALYTGSRSGPVFAASFLPGPGRAWVDISGARFHRLPEGAEEAGNKLSPTVRIGDRLLGHLARWERSGTVTGHVVEWQGAPVKSIKTAWARAVKMAGIAGRPTPHTLRHSAVTWLKQRGVSSFDVAAFTGMSERMVEEVYGQHDPAFQAGAARKISYRRA